VTCPFLFLFVVFPFCVGSMEWNLQVYYEVIITTRGVSHCVALPFTLKGILRQKKKNYENPIFHHEKI